MRTKRLRHGRWAKITTPVRHKPGSQLTFLTSTKLLYASPPDGPTLPAQSQSPGELEQEAPTPPTRDFSPLATSALLPRAGVRQRIEHVCFVPIADIGKNIKLQS